MDAMLLERCKMLRTKAQTLRAENCLLDKQAAAHRATAEAETKKAEYKDESRRFLSELAATRRGVMKEQVEQVAGDALKHIYDDNYSLTLEYGERAGRTTLEIKINTVTPDGVVSRDMSGKGGGVADTVALAIRILFILLNPKLDKFVVLDETWKHQDSTRIVRAAEFIKALVEKTGMQVLFITHHPSMSTFADKNIHLEEQYRAERQPKALAI